MWLNWRSALGSLTRISSDAGRLSRRSRRPRARQMRRRAGSWRPVVVADTQDNPGGGGHGDTTELLAELVRQGAKGAVVCLINDAESVAACQAAGEGATVDLSLGGKSDGMPLPCSARVE